MASAGAVSFLERSRRREYDR